METYDQRKPRSHWLPALAALALLILVSWWVVGRISWSRAPIVAEGVAVAGEAPLPTAVDTDIQFVQGTRARDAMAVDHEFTATGIRNLAAALEAIPTARTVRRGSDVLRSRRAAAMLTSRSASML